VHLIDRHLMDRGFGLREALKQPGIKTALDVLEATEKSSAIVKSYEAYVAWETLPSPSCNLDVTVPA